MYFFTKLIILAFLSTCLCEQFKQLKELHRAQILTRNDYEQISKISNTPTYISEVLDNILIPRVVGTENHENVVKYITNELKTNNWNVEIDEFTAKTPIFGSVLFKNIIATWGPPTKRHLVLACHYDSKYFKNEVFVGAIDSAVPCAMMLNIARTMGPLLGRSTGELGLKLIFLDGEEAVHEWGPKDSIYGARHLASKYGGLKLRTEEGEVISELDKMDLFVLLDLIGAPNPQFYSFFPNTQHWFNELVTIENNLHGLNLLKNHHYRYFSDRSVFTRIEDDHLPFLKRGVPILHLITVPFPKEWHTPADNRKLLDMDSILNINLILKSFISEYLHLFVKNDNLPEKEL